MKYKVISLVNLENEYVQINNDKRELFYDEINNNLIVFNPLDEDCNTENICNGIRTEAYGYLIDALNTNTDTVVVWSKVSGTTSDYTIFYDEISQIPYDDFEDVDKVLNIMYGLIKDERKISCKYTEVINGNESYIKF